MSDVTLTFYGGVNEIGGNKTLLEDEDTRLLLDFGLPYVTNKNHSYFIMKNISSLGLVLAFSIISK